MPVKKDVLPEQKKPAKKPAKKKKPVKPKEKKPTGAPRKEIDFRVLNNLCEIQCTGEEIAAVLDVDYDTMNARIKEKYGQSFSEYYASKKEKGKTSLRRKQWKLAETNAGMAIFLGKQILGQRDKVEVENTNLNLNASLDMTPDEADRILQEFGIRTIDKPKEE